MAAVAAVVLILLVSRTDGTSSLDATVTTTSLSSLGALVDPGPPGAVGPEREPIPSGSALASTTTSAGGGPIDGIACLGAEQSLFHIHVHLTVFVDGQARQVPAGIGIVNPQMQNTPQGAFVGGGSCLYWLHTHAADGIVHIESPVRKVFTLGDFFGIWGQPIGPDQLGPISGHVTALYDGRLFRGDPASLPLVAHAQIQLEVGTSLVKPESVTFQGGL